MLEIIITLGYFGIAFVIFGLTGFFAFFFPGDSLLFIAGFLASQSLFDINLLLIIGFVSAIVGDNCGYFIGNSFSHFVKKNKNKFFINKKHLKKAQIFYKKHGGRTLILGKFIPGVRSFVPFVAGSASMKYARFLIFSVISNLIWAVGLLLLGYYFGNQIPNVEEYILVVTILIIAISFLPFLIEKKIAKH